jgi:hypothetical protein
MTYLELEFSSFWADDTLRGLELFSLLASSRLVPANLFASQSLLGVKPWLLGLARRQPSLHDSSCLPRCISATVYKRTFPQTGLSLLYFPFSLPDISLLIYSTTYAFTSVQAAPTTDTHYDIT